MVAAKGGIAMTNDTTNAAKPPGARRSPFRLLWPIGLGLLVGSALYGGYMYWTHHKAQQALADAPGDEDMAKPAAEECAIARAALAAIHGAGSDKAWQKGAGVSEMSLAIYSKVINPADVAGYTDDEADNLRSKAGADWRWCPGLAAFIGGLGWSAMGPGDNGVAALGLGRPGMSKAGDEARVYEAFLSPNAGGALHVTRGPWLATLHKGPNGAWRVTATDDLKRANP
jgi:hypothetical protein